VPRRRRTLGKRDNPVEGHAGDCRQRDLGPHMSSAMRPTSVEIRKPIPKVGVPKNSATMAPMSASVELILSALK